MSSLNREDWSWITGIVLIICVTILLCYALHGYTQRVTMMMKEGYEQVCYPGGTGSYYHKAK